MAHAVDIPVTNLDEDEEDFSQEELDPTVLREDIDFNDNVLHRDSSFMGNVWNKLSSWTQKSYTRVPSSSVRNGIQLQTHFFDSGSHVDLRDDDSFDLSDEQFVLRRQKSVIWAHILRKSKKGLVYAALVGLLVAVIVLSVLLGKRGSKSTVPSKAVLSNGTDMFYPTTIFISLDGFHPHYISEKLTPTLHNLLLNGYGAPYMIPSFPSSTFPNHWTMATGLYPQYHGIVGNRFYDPVLEREFINVIPKKSLDPVFWGGEPIWSTAELQGVKSAIHMFPGSEVVFPKGNPSEMDRYNGTELLEIKTERVLGWLDRPFEQRPELIVAYVPNVDSKGHANGIKGEELEKELTYVDEFVGSILQGVEDRNATDIINVVIVSDHGMSPTSNDRLVYLDEIVNVTKIQHIDGWPLFGLRPFPEYTVEELNEELKSTFIEDNGYKFYLREDLPEDWHFGGDPTNVNHDFYERVAPIWVIPDIGFSITTHDDMDRKNGEYRPKGVHGYDNKEVLMRAIFLGSGPYFKGKISKEKPYKVNPFENVEVYGILCDMLNLNPAENNGTNLFVSENVLPEDWRDEQSYPGVSFNVGGFIKEDSTYDILYRPQQDRETTTLEGDAGKTTEAEDSTPNAGSVDDAGQGGTSDSSNQADEAVSNDDIQQQEASNDSAQDPSTDNNVQDVGSNDDQGESNAGGQQDDEDHKGDKEQDIWDKITDMGEDLVDDAEDLMDEVNDAIDDLGDAIEDAIHDLSDKIHKGGDGDGH